MFIGMFDYEPVTDAQFQELVSLGFTRFKFVTVNGDGHASRLVASAQADGAEETAIVLTNNDMSKIVPIFDEIGAEFATAWRLNSPFLTCPPGEPGGFFVYSFGKCASRVQQSEDCLLIESGKIPSQSPAKLCCNLEELPLHGFSNASAQAQQHAPTRRQPHV